jgi:hypothetical protein
MRNALFVLGLWACGGSGPGRLPDRVSATAESPHAESSPGGMAHTEPPVAPPESPPPAPSHAPATSSAVLLGDGEPAPPIDAIARLDVADEMSVLLVDDDAVVWGARPDHDPTREERMDPIALGVDDVSQAVAVGGGGVALLTGTGRVLVLGPERMERRSIRVPPMRSLAAGGGLCGVTRRGDVHCWDGFGSPEASDAPRAMPGLHHVRRIAVGALGVGLAVLEDGSLRSFGYGSGAELGIGEDDVEQRDDRVESPGLDGVVDVAALAFTMCASRVDGSVWCWGAPLDGRDDNDVRPRRLEGIDGVLSLHASSRALCARRRDGSVACIGALPDGLPRSGVPHNEHTRWVDAPVLRGCDELALSSGHACWLTGLSVACVGANSLGELGTLPRRTSVAAVPGVRDARWIDARGGLSCAGSSSSVWCWGSLAEPWLETETPRVVRLPEPASIEAAELGQTTGCVLRTGGTRDCYDGLPDAPRRTTTRTGVASLAGACALSSAARIICGQPENEVELEGAPFRSLRFGGAAYTGRHAAVSADGHTHTTFAYDAERGIVDVLRSTPDTPASIFVAGSLRECTVAEGVASCRVAGRSHVLGSDVTAMAIGGLLCWIDGGRPACSGFIDAVQTLVWSGVAHPDADDGPWSIADLDDATAIAAGDGHACALRATGEVACVGDARSGGVGIPPAWSSLEPVHPVLPGGEAASGWE